MYRKIYFETSYRHDNTSKAGKEGERYEEKGKLGRMERCIAMATLWMCMSLKLMATGECMANACTTFYLYYLYSLFVQTDEALMYSLLNSKEERTYYE